MIKKEVSNSRGNNKTLIIDETSPIAQIFY